MSKYGKKAISLQKRVNFQLFPFPVFVFSFFLFPYPRIVVNGRIYTPAFFSIVGRGPKRFMHHRELCSRARTLVWALCTPSGALRPTRMLNFAISQCLIFLTHVFFYLWGWCSLYPWSRGVQGTKI